MLATGPPPLAGYIYPHRAAARAFSNSGRSTRITELHPYYLQSANLPGISSKIQSKAFGHCFQRWEAGIGNHTRSKPQHRQIEIYYKQKDMNAHCFTSTKVILPAKMSFLAQDEWATITTYTRTLPIKKTEHRPLSIDGTRTQIS